MKKLLTSAIIILSSVSIAYAAQSVTDGGTIGSAGDNMTLTLSPNVTISYESGSGVSYQMTSKNSNGPMAYGVEAGDTAVYQQSVGTTTACPAASDDNDTSDSFSNATGTWTKMGS